MPEERKLETGKPVKVSFVGISFYVIFLYVLSSIVILAVAVGNLFLHKDWLDESSFNVLGFWGTICLALAGCFFLVGSGPVYYENLHMAQIGRGQPYHLQHLRLLASVLDLYLVGVTLLDGLWIITLCLAGFFLIVALPLLIGVLRKSHQ